MKFTFTEKRMGSSEELREYARRKISKLDRFFKTEAEAFVTFSLERGRFLAEITIHNNGMYYRASELTSDMYASVDSGVAAIERQIRRNKTRLEKRLREGALDREPAPAYAPEADEAEDEEEFNIIRRCCLGSALQLQQHRMYVLHLECQHCCLSSWSLRQVFSAHFRS